MMERQVVALTVLQSIKVTCRDAMTDERRSKRIRDGSEVTGDRGLRHST